MEILDWKLMSSGLNEKINKGIILYGASGSGEKAVSILESLGLLDKIIAVLDSDEKKWGKKWMQYEVTSPYKLDTITGDAMIVITSVYLKEIYDFLKNELKCSHKVCSIFAFRQALHYDIMNNHYSYIKENFVNKYKSEYNLWKDNDIIRVIYNQQVLFSVMMKCIMENQNSILLCGMPKTGNVSLLESFKEENKANVIFTYHASYYDAYTFNKLKEVIKKFEKNEIKIFSGVRTPIERIISHKWQDITNTYLNNDKCIPILLDENYEQFIDDLLLNEQLNGNKFNCRDYRYSDTFDWFTDHIQKAFGINVFKYPFDKNKGYCIIKNKNISIFVYRLDKLDKLEDEIKEFSQDSKFKLKKTNIASEKKYIFAYKEYLENIKIKKSFFDALVDSVGMSHFYTKEECMDYRKQWEDKLV